jgi:lipopolysaccharide export LptBFGC system permease protein LptF
MVTLHSYILRELLKAFGLTLLALTALFTMGGGLYNVLKFEGVTTGDLFTVLPLLLPVSATVTMPVAALFAATITYGRLAADNELVACRAAGINIFRVFLSAILLSVFAALSTAIAWNILFPNCLLQIQGLVRSNIGDLAYHRLLQRGYVEYGKAGRQKYVLTAEDVLGVPAEQLIEKGFDAPSEEISYFWVEKPTFLLVDQDGLEQFSVADGGLCQFDTRGPDVEFTLYVKNPRDYRGDGKRVAQVKEQKVGPYAPEFPFAPKPAMVRLETLRQWLAAPWRETKLGTNVERFLGVLRCYVFYTESARRLDDGKTLVLHDADGTRYEIRAGSSAVGRRELVMTDVSIAQHMAGRGDGAAGLPIRYEAPQGEFRAEPTKDGGALISLQLNDAADGSVLKYIPRGTDYGTPDREESLRLGGLLLPEFVIERLEGCTPGAVLDSAASLPTNEELEERRSGLQADAAKLLRKINGVIHFRFGLAASTLVTILMGAMLGVIFRGSRALAAFGLACIPLGIVLILIAMGKQITESQNTTAIGPFVIWGGLALVAVADALIMRLGVRR